MSERCALQRCHTNEDFLAGFPSNHDGAACCRAMGSRFVGLALCVAVVFAVCAVLPASKTGSSPTTTATSVQPNPVLKPIDPESFNAAVEAVERRLCVPGAVDRVRTQQGSYEAGVGTAELGA